MFKTLAMITLLALTGSSQQAPAASLAGAWKGMVTADAGQMVIEVTVTVDDGKASGTIKTGHGDFTIVDGRRADDVWTLPFDAGEGVKGSMKGVVKGDTFTGDWDFRPMAVGTFELERVKK
jgi:hypothetical protein